jgi:hypothetical protein
MFLTGYYADQGHRETIKLLLTADLHFRVHWFHWLIEEVPDFDLVCIAGDLLDIFNPREQVGASA